MTDQNQHTVAQAVREHIDNHRINGITLEVVEPDIRREEHWWSVPVRLSAEPPKLSEYFEALADVEGDLEENEQLKVLLLPMMPR